MPAVGVEREVAAADPSTPSQTLRVVDEHGAPVVDAEVAWTDAMPDAVAPRDDVEAEFVARARRRTRSDGTVTLPGASRYRFVLARKETAFGGDRVTFDAFEPVPDLVITEDRTLRARVVGPDGVPRAAVPVAVCWNSYESPWRNEVETKWLRSDEQGRVTVWHAQTLDIWNRTAPVVELSARVFGAATTTVRVPLRDVVPAVIDLPCAAHGSLRVRPQLADGRPCPWPLRCRLDAVDDGPAGEIGWPLPWGMREELVVPAVALGRQWQVGIDGFATKTCRGPTADHEQVLVDLAFAGAGVCATVRLVLPDGSPLVEAAVAIDGEWWRAVSTDADGRTTFLVPKPQALVAIRSATPDAEATVALPAAGPSGHLLDLGDVRLHNVDRVIATGRVVDAATGAGHWALVEVNDVRDARDEGHPARHVQSTAMDGRFELFELPDERFGDLLQLSVHLDGFAEPSLLVRRGSRDVRIALQRSPQLRATLQFDPDIQLLTMGCELRRGDDHIDPFVQHERPGFVQCTFALPTGEIAPDLAFVLEGSDEQPPLLSVPSGDWHHERGGYRVTLDLRGKLANVIARALVRGVAVELDQLFVRPMGASGPWSDIAHGSCHGCTALRGATFDAIAVPRDGFPVRTHLVGGENRIDLPPPATIVVQLAGWPDDRAGRVVVRQLTWHEPLLIEPLEAGVLDEYLDPRVWPRSQADWQDMGDRSDQWLAVPGAEITFRVARRGSYLAVPCVLVDNRPVPMLEAAVPLEVTTPGQRIDVTIHVDPAQLEAARR